MFMCVLQCYFAFTDLLVGLPKRRKRKERKKERKKEKRTDSEGTDCVGGQMRRDKECPLSGVTK